MFDRPAPESALWRLKDDERCTVTIGDKEYDAVWSAATFQFRYRDEAGAVQEPSRAKVDEWRPGGEVLVRNLHTISVGNFVDNQWTFPQVLVLYGNIAADQFQGSSTTTSTTPLHDQQHCPGMHGYSSGQVKSNL